MTQLQNLLLATQPNHPPIGFRILALVIGILFGGGGIALLFSSTINPIIKSAYSSNWLPTPATVTGSGLDNSSDRHGDTYQIAISYTYTHNEIAHQGNRYSFNQGATSIGISAMEKIIKAHPKGTPVTIYINPDDPTESVVSRSLPLRTYLGIPFSIPFLTVGIFGIGYALLSLKFHRLFLKIRQEITPITANAETSLIHTLLNTTKLPDHQKLFYLPGEKSKQILTGTFTNLFVNGIVVSIILIMLVELLTGGGFGIILSILLIPFTIVGVKLLQSLNKVRKIKNPPELLIAAEILTSADNQAEVTVQWLNLNKSIPKVLGFKTLHKPKTFKLSKLFQSSPPIDESKFHLIPKENLKSHTLRLPIEINPGKNKKSPLAGSTLVILYKNINASNQTFELEIAPHSSND